MNRYAMAFLLTVAVTSLVAQDDVAGIASDDLKIGKDENKRYFLIKPSKDSKMPKNGYGLLVVLPGGPGTADFHPFIKRIYKNSVPEDFFVAQPVAFKWEKEQEIVWPTAKNPVKGMKFTTEEFIDAIIKDVFDQYKVDPERIYTLSWSSSGPAAYAASLTNPKITGSFVAMSVFKPDTLPPLKQAKGHAYYLYHSPDDKVCPYKMAEQAEKDLKDNGAKVKFNSYEGGHGWRGNVFGDIKTGLEWLEKNHAPAPKK